MHKITYYRDCNIALFGLGVSGMASAFALLAGGAKVFAFDDSKERLQLACAAGIPVTDLRTLDFKKISALVIAPGVPLTFPKPHWSVVLAKSANVPIIGDMELFSCQRKLQAPGSCLIAITGTNGKSTTTALIHHIIKHSKKNVCLGGNIGKPVLQLPPAAENICHVLECSSYQIDLAPSLQPSIGILLNISNAHLDRHATMDKYASIKERLVCASDFAVVGVDDKYCRKIANDLKSRDPDRLCYISENSFAGFYLKNKTQSSFVGNLNSQLQRHENMNFNIVANLYGISSLRGKHNAQNAAAAWAACNFFGLSNWEIKAGLSTFTGLKHRMEMVGILGKVTFINDSKATNINAAIRAISSFNQIYWIVGGMLNNPNIRQLSSLFPRIVKAYLIGESATRFSTLLEGKLAYTISHTLENAFSLATRDALDNQSENSVVLLSPACASFDQFNNFEERGNIFCDLVKSVNKNILICGAS